MANRYRVTLSKSEREQLKAMARTSRTDARRFIHGRALLLCDYGEHAVEPAWKVADVARALGIGVRTVEHIKERFVEQGLEAALGRKARSAVPKIIFDGAFDARVTALACSDPPEGRSRWTVRLLAEKVVELHIAPKVSTMTIQRSLKKTNCVLI